MTREEIVAGLTVAYAVARVDGFADEEAATLMKEIKSFKFAKDPAEVQDVIDRYNRMSTLEAINIISQANEAARKEVHALLIFTLLADGEISVKEEGAYALMQNILNLPVVPTYDEAKEILGFE